MHSNMAGTTGIVRPITRLPLFRIPVSIGDAPSKDVLRALSRQSDDRISYPELFRLRGVLT